MAWRNEHLGRRPAGLGMLSDMVGLAVSGNFLYVHYQSG